MYRRKFLKDLPLAIAGTITLPQLLHIAAAVKSQTWMAQTPEEKVLAAVTDMIIPATSTPGALDAGVPAFILMAQEELVAPKEKEAFFSLLDQFSKNCAEQHGQSFDTLSEVNKKAHLTALMDAKDPFFQLIKGWTLTGYYTSQEGMTQALDYRPTPARYDPCVEVTPETKAEASYF